MLCLILTDEAKWNQGYLSAQQPLKHTFTAAYHSAPSKSHPSIRPWLREDCRLQLVMRTNGCWLVLQFVFRCSQNRIWSRAIFKDQSKTSENLVDLKLTGAFPCPTSVDYPSSADILSSIFHLLYIFVALLISSVDKHTEPPHSPAWMNNKEQDHRGICLLSSGTASALCKPASAEAMSNKAVTLGRMSLSTGERRTLRRLPQVYFARYSQVFNNFRS